MAPYLADLDKTKLTNLLGKKGDYTGGMADRIASYLMVEGAFNVNSTSVEAWKVFLSSLKGKPVAYLDKDKALSGGIKFDESTATGTAVAGSSLPNGKPFTGGSTEPSAPGQWSDWRELTDKEIEELAAAMVKQVKLRGPFDRRSADIAGMSEAAQLAGLGKS